MSGIHVLSFATSNWPNAHKRWHETGKIRLSKSKIVKSWQALDENDLGQEWLDAHKDRLGDRGFAYWSWKPYIIARRLAEIPDGDGLLYLDGGAVYPAEDERADKFELNLAEVTSKLDNSCFMSCATYPGTMKIWQVCPSKLLRQFNLDKNDDFRIRHPHYETGAILLLKCDNAGEFVRQWSDEMEACYKTFSKGFHDKTGEPNGYQHCGGDQAVFNILLFTHKIIPYDLTPFVYGSPRINARRRG